MPLYDLNCPHCDETDEYLLGAHEGHVTVECYTCAGPMTRKVNQDYSEKRIAISGDTCSGSCNYSNYYDDALDMHIDSRDHRKEVMKQKGLTEYAPDPAMASARKEARYIIDNSPKGDKVALDAARQQSRDQDSKRKERVISAAMDKAQKTL